MDTLGIAIIGTGQRGLNRHAATFLEQGAGSVEIRGLCDTNADNLKLAAERYPEARYVSPDYRAVIAREDIDAVVVATANCNHVEPSVFAFEHGKNVFCEKPLATTMAGCHAILEAADASGKVLEVGFVLRYAPVFARIKELIAGGRIGKPLLFHWNIQYGGGIHYFRTWHRLKEYSGGLNIEKACHDYDLLNWYFQEVPDRVIMWSGLNKFIPGTKTGHRCDACDEECVDRIPDMRGNVTRSTPDGNVDDGTSTVGCFYNTPKDIGDHYVGMLEYASGLRGTVQLCFYPSTLYGRQFDIIGSDGEICGNAHEACLEVHSRDPSVAPEYIDLKAESTGGHGGGDWRQVRRFLEAVRNGRDSLATGEDGFRAVAVGSAMERSVEEDAPVSVADLIPPEMRSVRSPA